VQCADRIDNDGNGYIDFPWDPHCTSPDDDDESGPGTPAACSNAVDDDGDTKIDFPWDPGCTFAGDTDETDPPTISQCADGTNNDGDLVTDFPNDYGCDYASDDDETNPTSLSACHDGIDNDGDSFTDWPNEPGCGSTTDSNEYNYGRPQCSDGADNNGDGWADYPAQSYCFSAAGFSESFGSGFGRRSQTEYSTVTLRCALGQEKTMTRDLGGACGTLEGKTTYKCITLSDGGTGWWNPLPEEEQCSNPNDKACAETEACNPTTCGCIDRESACSDGTQQSWEECQPGQEKDETETAELGCGEQTVSVHSICSPTCQWEPESSTPDGVCIEGSSNDANCGAYEICQECSCVRNPANTGAACQSATAPAQTGSPFSSQACTPDDCPPGEQCMSYKDWGQGGAVFCTCYKTTFAICDMQDTDTPPCGATQLLTPAPDLPGFGNDNAWVFTSGVGSVGVFTFQETVPFSGLYDELHFQAYSTVPTSAQVTMFLLVDGLPTTNGVVVNDYLPGGQFTPSSAETVIPLSAWQETEGTLTGIRLESNQDGETYYDNIYVVSTG